MIGKDVCSISSSLHHITTNTMLTDLVHSQGWIFSLEQVSRDEYFHCLITKIVSKEVLARERLQLLVVDDD